MYIKLLAFFLGFLITLLIINYFSIQKLKKETFTSGTSSVAINALNGFSPSTNTTVQSAIPVQGSTGIVPISTTGTLTDAKIIPYKSYKYMCINTFNNLKNISNTERRWYEIDLEKTTGIDDNKYHYFTYNNNINLIANDINKDGAVGANINTIELNGPKSFYFANNVNSNEVSEFTMIISGKVKDITNQNNIIFEMTGNTETINPQTLEYSTSLVNINIMKNVKNNFDIIITIGKEVYKGLINNLDKTNITNNDLLVMCLVYTTSEINLYINKLKFTYKNTESFRVKLGSTPVIINKGGSINMDLYNFIYYKYAIPLDEINKLTKYSYYYLSGLNVTNLSQCPTDQTPQTQLIDNKLKELEQAYIRNLQEKVKNDNLNANIKKIEIKPLAYNYDRTRIEDTPRMGIKLDTRVNNNSWFSWLF